ncbi:MAG: hypothetical protein V4713_03705 [Pseudomonadota bacterium]
MKMLILFLTIVAGTAALLFFRINMGMSWDDMSQVLKGDVIPRMLTLLVVVGALAVTVAIMSKRD